MGTRISSESANARDETHFRGTLRLELGDRTVAELAIDDQGVSVMHAAAGMKATWIRDDGEIAGFVRMQDAYETGYGVEQGQQGYRVDR